MGETDITVTPDRAPVEVLFRRDPVIRGPAVFGGVLEEAGCRIKSGMTR